MFSISMLRKARGGRRPGRPGNHILGGIVSTVGQHRKLQEWVEEMARLCEPEQIVWIDGSEEEKERLTREAAATRRGDRS